MHLVDVVTPASPAHIPCLDLVDVRSLTPAAEMFAETAILVEIWQDHAALQTTRFIAPGSVIRIDGGPGHLNAEVEACTRDGDYGYLTEVECAGLYSGLGSRAPWTLLSVESQSISGRPS